MTPPPVGDLINTQLGYNQANFNTQLGAGRVNTQNPYGGQNWQINPSTGQWTLNQTMAPGQQALQQGQTDLAQRGLNAAGGFFDDPRNTQRIEYQGPSYDYQGGSRDKAEAAIYNRGARYLDPQYKQGETELWDRMQSMGFNTSDPGFTKQLDTFRQGKERAYGDLRDAAITGGGDEATGELQRALSAEGARTGFLRGERSDQTALLNSLRQGSQPQMPWSPAQAQYGTPGLSDVNSAAMQLGNWNAQQAAGANRNAGWWGLGNNFINSPYGQKAMDAAGTWVGGFF